MPFKFDSASFFLTYPQAGNINWSEIIDHIKSIKDILWARICKELHQDGNIHYHVVGKWTSRVQSRNERFLDVSGQHPNIQSVRSIARAIKYVSKDGEFWDVGTVPNGESGKEDWLAHAKSQSKAQFFRMAYESDLSAHWAHTFWDLGRKLSSEIPTDYEPVLNRECFELLVSLPHETKSTVVIGNTGCGKSSWAKRVCIKPALWVRHMDVLRTFQEGYHKSIIFDDMSFSRLPRETQIYIVDQSDETHIHCRYGYAVIPAGIQKIFTANYYPFMVDSAIDRRVHVIHVQNPTSMQ